MGSGVILEKFGSKILMVLTFGGYIVGMVLVCMFPANPVPWFAVVSVLFVAFVRPVNSVPSLMLPELFGRKDYNRINSLGMAATTWVQPFPASWWHGSPKSPEATRTPTCVWR